MAGPIKLREDRPFASVDVAMRKLLELANAIEADHVKRIAVGVLNKRFIDAGGDAAKAAASVRPPALGPFHAATDRQRIGI
jgi:hypothetical protein